VIWTKSDATRSTSLSIPAASLSFVSACVLCILFHYEHTKSFRPSALLSVFLALTMLLDTALCRTLWLRQQDRVLESVFTVGVGVKLLLCILEAMPKSHIKGVAHTPSPESLSGPYSRSFYWWLNPLFLNGFKHVLKLKDLFRLEDSMSSEVLSRKMNRAWRNCKSTRTL
jgi:ATP-binding cassette subfamily C (CFTR/MRP) protein 1